MLSLKLSITSVVAAGASRFGLHLVEEGGLLRSQLRQAGEGVVRVGLVPGQQHQVVHLRGARTLGHTGQCQCTLWVTRGRRKLMSACHQNSHPSTSIRVVG
eukprot:151831-Prorocentrum_minimum.AAC.2